MSTTTPEQEIAAHLRSIESGLSFIGNLGLLRVQLAALPEEEINSRVRESWNDIILHLLEAVKVAQDAREGRNQGEVPGGATDIIVGEG